jgi:hypothetical protein
LGPTETRKASWNFFFFVSYGTSYNVPLALSFRRLVFRHRLFLRLTGPAGFCSTDPRSHCGLWLPVKPLATVCLRIQAIPSRVSRGRQGLAEDDCAPMPIRYSPRSGGSRSSNDKGFFSILHRNERRQDLGETYGRFA